MRIVERLDAPLLESFTVVGLEQKKLKRMRMLDRFDSEVSKGDGRIVKVDWMCVEDLES